MYLCSLSCSVYLWLLERGWAVLVASGTTIRVRIINLFKEILFQCLCLVRSKSGPVYLKHHKRIKKLQYCRQFPHIVC